MVRLGGSEIVALEIAEALYERGFEVLIRTNCLSDVLIRSARVPIRFSDSDELIDLCDFDFVWMHHNMVAHLDIDNLLRSNRLPTIVSAHLSPFEMLELVGVGFAVLVGARLVSNSEETKARLVAMGIDSGEVLNFKNAAPKRFDLNLHSKRQTKVLAKLLVVSNHIPDEVCEAMTLLKKRGVLVKVFGLGRMERRITEFDIQDADAVLTIGKTVQYALLSGVPVFCYDHFGGPGWLTKENFDKACFYNFSGRCCGTRYSSKAIFEKLVVGYEVAANEALYLKTEFGSEFLIDSYIDQLCSVKAKYYSPKEISSSMLTSFVANSFVIRLFYRRLEKKNHKKSIVRHLKAKIKNFLKH